MSCVPVDDANDYGMSNNLDIIKKINAILDNSLDVGSLANITGLQPEQAKGYTSDNLL